MAHVNIKTEQPQQFTHEGAPAVRINVLNQLRRSVLSCLLWEDEFYESGMKIADRIKTLANEVPNLNDLADLAIEARNKHNLRHVPLILLLALVKRGRWIERSAADVIEIVIQRTDEMGELLALYWADKSNKHMLPAQMRKGLARAMAKFDEYQLAKYDRDSAVKLRDVMRLVRPKPETKSGEQGKLWKRVVKHELEIPDTWEVALSGGADKKATFERLLGEGKLGYLALLRNLRNMDKAACDPSLVERAILARKGAHRVFPFRYVAAARAAPRFEPALDQALCESIAQMPVWGGETFVLVDVSASMDAKMSGKSDLKRVDAAATLASIIPGKVRVFTFSNFTKEVPPRRGMAGVDVILKSQEYASTHLGEALLAVNKLSPHRLIVITDEQSQTDVPAPQGMHNYMINVASNKNGVGYGNGWTHVDGFSENVLRYIHEYEKAKLDDE